MAETTEFGASGQGDEVVVTEFGSGPADDGWSASGDPDDTPALNQDQGDDKGGDQGKDQGGDKAAAAAREKEGGGGDGSGAEALRAVQAINERLMSALERLAPQQAAAAAAAQDKDQEKLPDLDAIDPDDDPIAYQKALGAHLKASQKRQEEMERLLADQQSQAEEESIRAEATAKSREIADAINALADDMLPEGMPEDVKTAIRENVGLRIIYGKIETFEKALADPRGVVKELMERELKPFRAAAPAWFGQNGNDGTKGAGKKGGIKMPGAGAAKGASAPTFKHKEIPQESSAERTEAIRERIGV